MSFKFDLFGRLIPDNYGKPGANGHVPTEENYKKVRALLSRRAELKEIANALDISIPTLKKHYFRSGAKGLKAARVAALREIKVKNQLLLEEAAEKHNVGAIRALNDIADRELRQELANELSSDPAPLPSAPPTPKARGKKDQQISAAEEAVAQDDLLNPRVH